LTSWDFSLWFAQRRSHHIQISSQIQSQFLGAFTKQFQKVIESLVMSCHCVRPLSDMEHGNSHQTDIHETSYVRFFLKSVKTFTVELKFDKSNRHFTWRPKCTYDWSS
jgi:hypothetical protein